MNHVYLMGTRFDILMQSPINRNDSFVKYLRQLLALRASVRDFIYQADFRDEIGLGPLPERVYAKLFRRTDGSGLAVNLVDRRFVRKGPFPLTLDLAQHSITKPGAAVLHEFGGRQTRLETKLDKDTLTLQVPELQGEVGTVVIRQEQ